MKLDPFAPVDQLLPRPKHAYRGSGLFCVSPATRIINPTGSTRLEAASRRQLIDPLPLTSSRPGRGDRLDVLPLNDIYLTIDPRLNTPSRQGYRLHISDGVAEVVGASAAGCFYAIQTFAQLVSLGEGFIPGCTILDWPTFSIRGLLHDVTRGKVPKLSTLKKMADRLALLKLNQLQLYMEHAFVFDFDREICTADEGLTPEDVQELDRYCRDRFIQLVPALASLGHMGRILSMPRYAHWAEVPATDRWEQWSWPQRARGLTLNCTDPRAMELVERLWSDVLDAFSSSTVNICGDEPHDLGAGRGKQKTKRIGAANAYLAHLIKTRDFCAARGRSVQLWSDVLNNHPEVIDRIPRDMTLLHWGYDDQSDYDAAQRFIDAGLETIVCPGTSGWKRIIHAMGLAERNLKRFASTGEKCGAAGLLNTDWGDHGHFQSLACGRHGIALGAALSWDADHPIGDDFDSRFARVALGTSDVEGIGLLRGAAAIGDRFETWHRFWRLLRDPFTEKNTPNADELTAAGDSASKFIAWSSRQAPPGTAIALDQAELTVAAQFTTLFIDRVDFARRLREQPSAPLPRRQVSAWTERLDQAMNAYESCWLARNKPTGLLDIRDALTCVSRELQELAGLKRLCRL